MGVITLGPLGTFSSEAAKKLYPKRKLLFASSTADIFFRLSDPSISMAVVPLENTYTEFVPETISNLLKYDFTLLEKITLHVSFHLAGEIKDVDHLYADPYAFKQCRARIKEVLPTVKIIETSNNALSALQFKAAPKNAAALVSPFTLREYKLPLLTEHMEDDSENFSAFLTLGKDPIKKSKKSGTAFLVFSEFSHTSQSRIIKMVHEKKTPLLKIKNLLLQEGHTPLYFLEVEGHIEDSSMRHLSEDLNAHFLVKCLGSYALST